MASHQPKRDRPPCRLNLLPARDSKHMFLRGLTQKNPAFLDAEDVVLCSRFLNVVCIVIAMWCDILYHNFISLSFYSPKLVQPLFPYCVTAVLADILCNLSASLFILLFLLKKYNPSARPRLTTVPQNPHIQTPAPLPLSHLHAGIRSTEAAFH